MMGRDDIPVGRGEIYAMGQKNPSSAVGDCKYIKAIPHGGGGFLDSDTLYGFARNLPRSPRRYTAENSVKFGAPRDTGHPELRQPLALEVWQSITKSLDPRSKITILTNGPLSNLAQIILSGKNLSSIIEKLYIVGGHINYGINDEGNVFTIPSNKYAELNMFLDPLAVKTVLDSELDVTLIPLVTQRRLSCASHRRHLKPYLSTSCYRGYSVYKRNITATFIWIHSWEKLLLGGKHLNSSWHAEHVKFLAAGDISEDGRIVIDREHGRPVKILESVNPILYYRHVADVLGNKMQSAVIGSYNEQKKLWNTPPNLMRYGVETR